MNKLRLLLTLMIVLLSACVTTTNAPKARVVDADKTERTHVHAGLTYLRQGSREDARRHFSKALGINSRSAGGHNGMALIYQLESNYRLADKHFIQAIESDSSYTLARNNYGVFLFRQKRYSEAVTQFLTSSEDLNYNSRQHAMVNLGRTQKQLGDTDAAMASFKRALGIQISLPTASLEIASIYFDQAEYTSAKYYLDLYSKHASQTSRSLWLGVQLERIFGNKDKEASYALALKNLHPYSKEYLEYKNTVKP